MKTLKLKWAAVVVLSVIACGCMPTTQQQPPLHVKSNSASFDRPNILMVVFEDMSPRIGAYGDEIAHPPTLDKLANESVVYENAFTTAGVCAPSRVALITGSYQQPIGGQHMRTYNAFGASGPAGNYHAVPPEGTKAFPELLREAGYHALNINMDGERGKTDYQFGEPFTIWDDDSPSHAWRERDISKPFFSMVTVMQTHESFLWPIDPPANNPAGEYFANRNRARLAGQVLYVSPDDVKVPAYLPDTPAVRRDWVQPELSTRSVEILEHEGFRFRDSNKNESLDPYEDWRLSSGERAADLIGRMTLEEKVGQLAHGNIWPNAPFGAPATGFDLDDAEDVMSEHHVTAFIPFVTLNFLEFVGQNNAIQEMAEEGRLGIPATISTDPRHHFMTTIGASTSGEGFSQWPEPLGFAALDDAELVLRFARIAASEYRATGFTQALSPQADLATEPRWTRIYNTFGEDPEVAARMVGAYIEGFQGAGDGVLSGHVSTVVKHWVGYGAAKDGLDSHNYYGRFGDLEERDLAIHVEPFVAAFGANVAGVMPAYSIFEGLTVNGQPVESVGAAYSEVLIKDLLRGEYGFDGVILSDWAITNDCPNPCKNGRAPGDYPNPDTEVSTAWGVLDLTRPERFALAMNVGVDQFGGVNDTGPIHEAVEQGLITEDRLDESVLRILEKTFAVGLFEAPFVDAAHAKSAVNTKDSQALALETQSRALVVLKRDTEGPLLTQSGQKVFLMNSQESVLEDDGYSVVSEIAEADVAIVRLSAPYETLHPNYFFGMQQHEGSLAFDPDGEQMRMLRALDAAGVRVIVDVALDRPAVLTEIAEIADVLIANFGASDLALLRALDSTVPPEGRLPFELPSSMKAVERQNSGRPADSESPLYPLHYSANEEGK